ncbi:MAG TPA: ATP-binding protein [Thermotogota bacterium]|nr:ATP-binding protein [Thermotogota bacterium]
MLFTAKGRAKTIGIPKDPVKNQGKETRLFYDRSPVGIAYQELLFDAKHVPVDFRFIEVNPLFERLLGLKRSAVVGKSWSELFPDTERSDYNRLSEFALAVLNESERELTFYVPVTDRWLRMKVFSVNDRFFFSVLTDMTLEIKLSEVSELFLQKTIEEIGYQVIADKAKEFTGCKYGLFNIFREEEMVSETVALIGVKDSWQRVSAAIGFPLIGAKWPYDHSLLEKFGDAPILMDLPLHELTKTKIPKALVKMLQKMFGVGESLVCTIYQNGRILGNFTLLFPSNERLTNPYPLQLYARQVGLLILRSKTEKELIQAKKDAEAASRTKSRFLANMSHELRTPLTGMVGFGELLQKTPLNQEQAHFLSYILDASRILKKIVDNVLDYAKIEADTLPIQFDACELLPLCQESIRLVQYETYKKRLSINLDYDPAIPFRLLMDGYRLRQVLLNLLANAVKFTEIGEVRLKVSLENRNLESRFTRIRFEISDTGIGITESDMQRVFDAFQQADCSDTRRYGGLGLGLSISLRLLKKMGTSLQVKSEPNKGSVFSFALDFEVPKEEADSEEAFEEE